MYAYTSNIISQFPPGLDESLPTGQPIKGTTISKTNIWKFNNIHNHLTIYQPHGSRLQGINFFCFSISAIWFLIDSWVLLWTRWQSWLPAVLAIQISPKIRFLRQLQKPLCLCALLKSFCQSYPQKMVKLNLMLFQLRMHNQFQSLVGQARCQDEKRSISFWAPILLCTKRLQIWGAEFDLSMKVKP